MYHTIEFATELMVDLETSAKEPLDRLWIQPGVRRRAQIKPFVMQTSRGPIEVADLFFEDGTATRTVPFFCFSFVD
jgi:hypothetical protein